MKTLRKKSTASIVSFILMLTIAAPIITCLPSTVLAQATEINTKSFIAVEPSPVGVGQWVFVTVWIQPLVPTGFDVFHDLEVTITRPDDTTETFTLDTYTHGGNFLSYTPAQTGTYEFQLSYPGEYFATTDVTYKASTSPVAELEVQTEPVEPWPDVPLPTDYWTRPISAEFREWWSISGNWLQHSYNSTYATWFPASAYNPYSQAARSPHIMWTKPLAFGGLVGGEYGNTEYYTGLSYETKLPTVIIMNGILYYNLRLGSSGLQGFAAIDLRTGEELWRNMDGTITVGQLFHFDSGNQHGITPYLWSLGSTYRMYDAFTGQLILSFANASTGTVVRGDDGTMYVYTLNAANGWLSMWNSTKAFVDQVPTMTPPFVGSELQEHPPLLWRPRAGVFDWRKGIQWNTTVPIVNVTIGEYVWYPSIQSIVGDVIIAFGGHSVHRVNGVSTSGRPIHVGYSAKTGQMLWAFEREPTTYSNDGWICAFGDGIYADFDTVGMRWVAYDVRTGLQKWVSEPHDYPWGTYVTRHGCLIADGKLFAGSYDGHVRAFDIEDGKEIWKFFSGEAGYETPYSHWPWFHGLILADGVLYAATGEHSPTTPLYRGQKVCAIDAETGNGIWNITGLSPLMAIAEGYLVGYNAYDNRMYCFGKGPSATTITVTPGVISLGDSIMITGTVTDQSTGGAGTPCVSKESMAPWMEYIHMQKPIPAEVTGVEVSLDTLDPNGNFIHIGTVTSDMSGMFKKMYTPEVPGEYTIIATFMGDESYGSSYAETAIGVGPAPEEPTEPAVQEDIDQAVDSLTPMFLGLIVAVVVAIVIGILNFWAIRRRK